MLCLIDNYDSFTYNIVHYLHELDVDVRVIRNDQMTVQEVLALKPTHIVLSPGPGTPDESGISKALLSAAAVAGIPVLGVCLGHEIIGEVFGGQVVHARRVMHGKANSIRHVKSGVFSKVPDDFTVARYHSLIVKKEDLPECLEMTAWTVTENGDIDEIMGIAHKTLPIHGVQFHPESIMTEHGHHLFSNFLAIQPRFQAQAQVQGR